MSFTGERLYSLLPAAHRIRDEDPANPSQGALRQLLHIIADQFGVLEEELQQLYENHFVETAAEWALPYIGELIGLRGVVKTGLTSGLAPRAEIANTIAYRRRKGTACVLEQLARDTTGQPAAVVEFFQRIITTQHLNHLRMRRTATVSLRNPLSLEFIDAPFEKAARTVEVRRIATAGGRWNIPNVGIFLWRLHAAARTRAPLVSAGLAGGRHFYMHPLRMDVPLCANPQTESSIEHLAEPLNVPTPLTRRLFAGDGVSGQPSQFHPSARWYGSGKSVLLYREQTPGAHDYEEIPADEIVVSDLTDSTLRPGFWMHDDAAVSATMILLDPVRGRVVFPTAPAGEVCSSFHNLQALDIGGGEYGRTDSFDSTKDEPLIREVSQQNNPPLSTPLLTIAAGIVAGPDDFRIEIGDSGRYVEDPVFDATGRQAEIRAADGFFPHVVLSADLELSGAAGIVVLNGLLISGGGIEVRDHLASATLRHCTVWGDVRVSSTADGATLTLEDCIVTGRIRIPDNVRLHLKNCIIDAGAQSVAAIARTNAGDPAGELRMENCTVIGRVHVRVMELASNSILLTDRVTVASRQEGCVRFSWLPEASIVPRPYQCLPRDEDGKRGVRPYFVSLNYVEAGYGQLSLLTPDVIRNGADDESEMGAGHDTYESRREAHLRVRMEEYLRFGLEAGLLHQT
ncbi:MAG: hypothetical protein O2960_03230 [Verrucomicrobia bacterium]|nr:hypothetical protein [Verrucomicrobiota bacterium]